MEQGKETIFLRKRFGFVKLAIQSGAHLVPAFAFGQSSMCDDYRSAVRCAF
jgi:2-acylglycerol O-acyltransferase 2